MRGAIIGDIIGVPYETKGVPSLDFQLFPEGAAFSDDTVLTIAVAETLMDKGPGAVPSDFATSFRIWGHRYKERGFGSGFMKWLISDVPYNASSLGNGACMRVSPVAWLMTTDVSAEAMARTSCRPSHNTQEAMAAATAVVRAIRQGRGRHDARHVKQIAIDLFDREPHPFEFRPIDRQTGSLKAIPSVLRAFSALMEAEDFENAIRLAMAANKDTDTAGAIAGAIAESVWGIPDHIWKKASAALPADMLDVIRRFDAIHTP